MCEGVCVASLEDVVVAFDRHVPPVSAWLSRIFFASIGLQIPTQELFELDAMFYGLVLSAVAVASKVYECSPTLMCWLKAIL